MKHGDFYYFVQDGCKVISTTFQLCPVFSKLHQKCSSNTELVTERVKCKGANQRQHVYECKSIDYQCATKPRSA